MNLDEHSWQNIAKVAAMKADAIIEYAAKTKYFDLPGYMERDWLFNPFTEVNGEPVESDRRLPSIRVHRILRADLARHPHSHPWNARTIILRGWYKERRLIAQDSDDNATHNEYTRVAGDTATLNADEYHHICEVSEGGVWTMFITGEYVKGWGFSVRGQHVPWREYEAMYGRDTDYKQIDG